MAPAVLAMLASFVAEPGSLPALVEGPEEDDVEPPPNRPYRDDIRDRLTGDLFGVWPWLEERGVTVTGTLIYDYGAVLSGGIRRREAGRGLLDIDATFNMQRIAGIDGATGFIEFLNHWGRHGSDDAGDWQWFSNIDGPQFAQISELWWEQKLFEERIRIKAGKFDANTEFAYAELAGDFLNSSFGTSPTNFVMPTYPDPATGVAAFAYPTDNLSLAFGVFDGATHAGVPTGARGPRTFFGAPSDLYFIGELGLRWELDGGRDGRFTAGGWGHDGRFDEWDGGSREGTAGFYATFDQLLWRENPGDEDDAQGVGATTLYGWSDPDVSEVEHHLALAFAWNGPIPGRDDDAAGFGATWVRFSSEEGAGFDDDGEVAIEVFYRLQLTPFFSVKPDLQYIVNPGGDAELDDAVVATLRIEVVF